MRRNAINSIVGDSVAMQRLRALVELAAPTPLSVLIEGPTGAGKELVAEAIHELSGRPGRFVAFNVAAISETMFEDALFGHVRGAFTGAVSDSTGYLREADRGTTFFDEIGGLPGAQQVKLLRAIETRRFRPVGARTDSTSEFRLVAASNESLDGRVREGTFRADLLHRLGAIRIRVPALSERLEDLPVLVRHFLDCSGQRHIPVTPSAIRRLQEQNWPGNVRELKHVVQWAAVLNGRAIDETVLDRLQVLEGSASPIFRSTIDDTEGTERLQLRELLVRHNWNADGVARELGVHRATVYRWMKRLRVAIPRVPALSRALTLRESSGSILAS